MARKSVPTVWGNANPAGVVAPSASTQNNGYGAVKPPYQEHNWVFELMTSMLQNAEQLGIMEWSTDTEYPLHGRSMGTDGNWYKSKQAANQGNDPVLDVTNTWWDGEKNDTEYVAITGHSVNSVTKSSNGTWTYIISGFTGTGLVQSEIRTLYVQTFLRKGLGSVDCTYPDGSTRSIAERGQSGDGDDNGRCSLVVPVPINKGQTDITITLQVPTAGNFSIIGASQRSF